MAADKKIEDPKVVKVAPYPINCKFQSADAKPPLECLIQRLEETGFIFKSIGHFYRIGESYTCEFEIPVTKEKITEVVKVMKTSESSEAYLPRGSKERVMTVEVHFKSSFGEFSKAIRSFVRKIGQKAAPVPPAKVAAVKPKT